MQTTLFTRSNARIIFASAIRLAGPIRSLFGRNGRPFQLALESAAAILMLLVLAGGTGLAQEVTGTFVPIEVPGARVTGARAITADGRIVGFFTDASGVTHGFLLVDGSFRSIDVPVPGARSTTALGINSFRGESSTLGIFCEEYRSIDFPGGTRTRAFGMNAHGDVVGTYVDAANRVHGFLAEVAHKKR